MIVTDLEIDGFGVWTNLRLGPFDDGLNVIHGPNEAGKTTLLEFVRSMLYGLTGYRRDRYLPPLLGGVGGGWLGIADRKGRYRIARHERGFNGEPGSESLAVTTSAGGTQDPAVLARLLADVDEATFTNVFAVGLREMQELCTLGDTAAARLLYDLSTGVDRVSLGNVIRELAQARRRLLAPEPEPCQLRELATERDRLRREVEELAGLTRDYVTLARERDDLETEIVRLTQEERDLKRRLRLVETANLLAGKWTEREAIDRQLAQRGDPRDLPERPLERLDEANGRIRQAGEKISACIQGRRELRSAAAALGLDPVLWRQAPRIAALAEQMEWISTLERQTRECDKEVTELETQVAAERKRLGLDATQASGGPVTTRALEALRPVARQLHLASKRYKETQGETRASQQAAASLAAEAEAVLGELPEKDLMTAVESAGTLVTQLRRRVQLEKRLEQLVRQDADLEERSHDLIDRQLLPLWVLAGLGGLFVFGVVLILAAWFLPASVVGSLGWLLALLGLGATISAAATKHNMEKSAERQLESCEKQLSMLKHSIQSAKREREELDAQLPSGGGPMTVRLEQAEKRLAVLEELLPLESRQKLARQDGKSAALKAQEAKRELGEARRLWSAALKSAGCPETLSPKQVVLFTRGNQQVRDLERRLERRRQERKQVERSWLSLHDRVSQLAADVGLNPDNSSASDQVRRMRQAVTEQDTLARQREEMAARSRKLRHRQAGYLKRYRLLRRRRVALIRSTGAKNEPELRRLVAQAGEWRELHERRQILEAEISAALGTQITEEEVRGLWTAGPLAGLEGRPDDALALLDPHAPRATGRKARAELEALWDEVAARLAACEAALKSRHERRGQLSERLAPLANDLRPLERQAALALCEGRFREALERWQALAVTGQLVESVRRDYERDRQPETLREASEYLEQLTSGQYRRIWTPLSEDVLLVDNRQGQSLPVEALSRGTREQLFLSLRLALATAYARRGAALPLVLDDVFVNFDTRRTKAAVSLVLDFAAAGHQVFVFTCHDHVMQMFKARQAPVISLPGTSWGEEEVEEEQPIEVPFAPAAEAPLPLPAPLPFIQPPFLRPLMPDLPPAPSEDEAPFEGPGDDGFGFEWRGEASREFDPEPDVDEAPYEGPEADEPVWVPVVEHKAWIDRPPPRPVPAPRNRWFFKGDGAEEFEGEFAERPGPEDDHAPLWFRGKDMEAA